MPLQFLALDLSTLFRKTRMARVAKRQKVAKVRMRLHPEMIMAAEVLTCITNAPTRAASAMTIRTHPPHHHLTRSRPRMERLTRRLEHRSILVAAAIGRKIRRLARAQPPLPTAHRLALAEAASQAKVSSGRLFFLGVLSPIKTHARLTQFHTFRSSYVTEDEISDTREKKKVRKERSRRVPDQCEITMV